LLGSDDETPLFITDKSVKQRMYNFFERGQFFGSASGQSSKLVMEVGIEVEVGVGGGVEINGAGLLCVGRGLLKSAKFSTDRTRE
jgi:hypothetical protein